MSASRASIFAAAAASAAATSARCLCRSATCACHCTVAAVSWAQRSLICWFAALSASLSTSTGTAGSCCCCSAMMCSCCCWITFAASAATAGCAGSTGASGAVAVAAQVLLAGAAAAHLLADACCCNYTSEGTSLQYSAEPRVAADASNLQRSKWCKGACTIAQALLFPMPHSLALWSASDDSIFNKRWYIKEVCSPILEWKADVVGDPCSPHFQTQLCTHVHKS